MELTCAQCGADFGQECRVCEEQFCSGCARRWREAGMCEECRRVRAAPPVPLPEEEAE